MLKVLNVLCRVSVIEFQVVLQLQVLPLITQQIRPPQTQKQTHIQACTLTNTHKPRHTKSFSKIENRKWKVHEKEVCVFFTVTLEQLAAIDLSVLDR